VGSDDIPFSGTSPEQARARPVNQLSLAPQDLLTAFSRSRHFEATESGLSTISGPQVAACRSLFSRRRSGPLGCAAANPS